ncbi:hypothetical protein [Pseudarthrobacter sp. N5]|uniref:hypothetical protein n=1 Tax=Pseudarthrobacter sp. N5 TaxID=3418416 RepID=UPI003CEAEBE7
MISKKTVIDVSRYDDSRHGGSYYDPMELDRHHNCEIAELPQGAVLELLVHGFRPHTGFHRWGRPDLHIIITSPHYNVAEEWEAMFLDQYEAAAQRTRAA